MADVKFGSKKVAVKRTAEMVLAVDRKGGYTLKVHASSTRSTLHYEAGCRDFSTKKAALKHWERRERSLIQKEKSIRELHDIKLEDQRRRIRNSDYYWQIDRVPARVEDWSRYKANKVDMKRAILFQKALKAFNEEGFKRRFAKK